MMYKKIVHSLEETNNLGFKIGAMLHDQTVILLTGDLGAGKTTFTKALAKGLGVKEIVNSPTFTILKEYDSGRLPLYHFDAYRLEDSYSDLGFDEYIHDKAVSVIEWPMYMMEDIPDTYLKIEIHTLDEYVREMIFIPIGKYYEKLCEEIFAL